MESPKYRRAVERILEDESLTAALTDPTARLLLEWGVSQTKAILREMMDCSEEETARRLNALRRTIRRIARLAGQVPPDRQLQQVQALLDVALDELSIKSVAEIGGAPDCDRKDPRRSGLSVPSPTDSGHASIIEGGRPDDTS